jgi:hypothetical protein
MSCSPSLIEIMLKYYKLVPDGYYALQDKFQNQNVGLTYFAGQVIEGLKIERHVPSAGQSFVDRLIAEWPTGRIIGLYCVTPNDPNRNCHGWIVSEVLGDSVFLLSKYSEEGNGEGKHTAILNLPFHGTGAIEITDLIFGEPTGGMETAQAKQGLAEGIASMERGDGEPAETVFAQLRKKHDFKTQG